MITGNELITGSMIRLTATSKNDAPHFADALNDTQWLHTLTGDSTPLQIPGEWYVKNIDSLDISFGIRTLDDDRFAGVCGLGDVMWQARQARLLMALPDLAHWSNGLAVDVVTTLVRYAFMEVNLNRIDVRVPDDFAAWATVLRQSGWVEEGRLSETHYRDGALHDTLVFGILRSDYDAINSTT